MEVTPSASFSVRMRLAITLSEIGSSPENGSSYMMSMGSSAIARASATRRDMPPESSSASAPDARRPTASISSAPGRGSFRSAFGVLRGHGTPGLEHHRRRQSPAGTSFPSTFAARTRRRCRVMEPALPPHLPRDGSTAADQVTEWFLPHRCPESAEPAAGMQASPSILPLAICKQAFSISTTASFLLTMTFE